MTQPDPSEITFSFFTRHAKIEHSFGRDRVRKNYDSLVAALARQPEDIQASLVQETLMRVLQHSGEAPPPAEAFTRACAVAYYLTSKLGHPDIEKVQYIVISDRIDTLRYGGFTADQHDKYLEELARNEQNYVKAVKH